MKIECARVCDGELVSRRRPPCVSVTNQRDEKTLTYVHAPTTIGRRRLSRRRLRARAHSQQQSSSSVEAKKHTHTLTHWAQGARRAAAAHLFFWGATRGRTNSLAHSTLDSRTDGRKLLCANGTNDTTKARHSHQHAHSELDGNSERNEWGRQGEKGNQLHCDAPPAVSTNNNQHTSTRYFQR